VLRVSYVEKAGAKCWEATVAPVELSEDGDWNIPQDHYISVGDETMIDPKKLDGYVLVDVMESQFPVRPTDVDEMIAAHEAREIDRSTAAATGPITAFPSYERPTKRARR